MNCALMLIITILLIAFVGAIFITYDCSGYYWRSLNIIQVISRIWIYGALILFVIFGGYAINKSIYCNVNSNDTYCVKEQGDVNND